MIRETGAGYNKKVDVWSLGCILFELCIGKKAFRDDFATFQFATTGMEFVTEFPSWFDQSATEQYGLLIREMLHPDHERRPSIEELSRSYSRFVSLVSRRTWDEIPVETKDDDFFIKSKYLLGTDIPSDEALHCVRWDKGMPGSTREMNAPQLARWKQVINARRTILGADHPNTTWSIICLAWTYISVGETDSAILTFQEALNIAQRLKGPENEYTLSVRYGLAWAYSETGKHVISAKVFEKVLNIQKRAVEPINERILSTRCALARNDLFWRPREEAIPQLESIIENQTSTLGYDHRDTIESISYLASAYFLQRGVANSSQAEKLFAQAQNTRLRLFGIEHPMLLSLCGLSWTYMRLGQRQEATRIHSRAEKFQRVLLGSQYPSTTSSLSALAILLDRGPISWAFARGNNRSGALGTNKCEVCRKRKIKVPTLLFQSDSSANSMIPRRSAGTVFNRILHAVKS